MKTLILAATALAVTANIAIASPPTDVQKCQKEKLSALGKRDRCLQRHLGKTVVGKSSNETRCHKKFARALAKAEAKMADVNDMPKCRWLENIDEETKELDGTVTDLDTGLQWELKTTEAGRHYYLDHYTWSDSGKHPNGKAFVEFLGDLNHGVQTEARSTHKCFAKHCDWRIPTISELQSIVSEERPACLSTPDVCTTIPGETARAPWSYLSSTSVFKDDTDVWVLDFSTPILFSPANESQQPPLENTQEKLAPNGGFVRAVRGGPLKDGPNCDFPILINEKEAAVNFGYTDKVSESPLNSAIDNAKHIVDEMTKELSPQAIEAIDVTTVAVYHCDPYLVTGAQGILEAGQPARVANNYETERYDYLTLLAPTEQCKYYQGLAETSDGRFFDNTIGVGVPAGVVLSGPKCARKVTQDTCYTTTICDTNLVSSSTVEHHDAYPDESILVHEFGHTVMNVGLYVGSPEDQERYAKIKNFFSMTYQPKYCQENPDIYACQRDGEEMWAEATQSWFGASVKRRCPGDLINPGLCPASEIQDNLSELADLLAETYGELEDITPLPPFGAGP